MGSGLLGEITADDVGVVGEPESAHRTQVARAAWGCAGALSAVDVGDAPVPEVVQVLDRHAGAVSIVGGHRSDAEFVERPPHRHQRHLGSNSIEPGRRQTATCVWRKKYIVATAAKTLNGAGRFCGF